MSVSLATSATTGAILLFPNGCRNSDDGADRDVWLGDTILEELRVTTTAGTPAAVRVDIMHGILAAAGGTVLVNGSIASRLRATVASAGTMGAAIGNLMDAFYTHTDTATLNAVFGVGIGAPTLRSWTKTFTPALNQMVRHRFGDGLVLPTGSAIKVAWASATQTIQVEADFVPHTSGAVRRRLASKTLLAEPL